MTGQCDDRWGCFPDKNSIKPPKSYAESLMVNIKNAQSLADLCENPARLKQFKESLDQSKNSTSVHDAVNDSNRRLKKDIQESSPDNHSSSGEITK